jgi:hypothetical protein
MSCRLLFSNQISTIERKSFSGLVGLRTLYAKKLLEVDKGVTKRCSAFRYLYLNSITAIASYSFEDLERLTSL